MQDNGGCLAWGSLPLRRYAEFGGRSRRMELVAFYLLAMLVCTVAIFGMMLLHSSPLAVVGWLVPLALICPTLALAVRRLHDTGRTGWWLLLAAPGIVMDVWHHFYPAAAFDPEIMASLAGADQLLRLCLLVLLLWKDDPEPNRYGLNPRFDPPEPTGHPGDGPECHAR